MPNARKSTCWAISMARIAARGVSIIAPTVTVFDMSSEELARAIVLRIRLFVMRSSSTEPHHWNQDLDLRRLSPATKDSIAMHSASNCIR